MKTNLSLFLIDITTYHKWACCEKKCLNPCPAELAFANSVDPDQLASKKPTDLDLH